MVHNTLYNQFYNFAPLKAAAPLKGTIIEFAIYHAKKYEKQKMKKKVLKKNNKKVQRLRDASFSVAHFSI